jgi:dipeptidyl aminopeptidase/acylaminoacyl peptidase
MEKNLVYHSATLPSQHGKRPFSFDCRYIRSKTPKPLIIFIHGFKGFKDWGHFNLLADYFAEQGFAFCKFNFSYNGTTPNHPTDFIDLDAFGQNTYSKELDDIGTMIDYFCSLEGEIHQGEIDRDKLCLMGHSRGGGVAVIKAAEDNRIKALVTLAGISDLSNGWREEILAQWKRDGVRYIHNARTMQNMPLYYSLAEDFLKQQDRFDMASVASQLKIPALIVHGTHDMTLPVSMAQSLKSWLPNAHLILMEGADHTFGGYHPYPIHALPHESKKAADAICVFLKQSGLISD